MRRLTIICAMALAGCGAEPIAPPPIPPDMLQSCAGWTGRAPQTQGELLRAALAERTGRLCANEKLETMRSLAVTLR